jgi:hypothetical protein
MKNVLLYFSFLFILFESKPSFAEEFGSMRVLGEPGRFQIFQKVKAVRCRLDTRGACDVPIFLISMSHKQYPQVLTLSDLRTQYFLAWLPSSLEEIQT